MAQDRRYQLVLLGPAVDQFASELKSEFDAQIRDIGLDPAKDVQILRSPNMKATAIDWDAAPVAIWFGNEQSPSQKDLDLLEDFQVRRPNPVFPVCETLTNYEKKVPASLRPINGEEWNAPTIVGNVLKAFNLTRDQRQAFISYRRLRFASGRRATLRRLAAPKVSRVLGYCVR